VSRSHGKSGCHAAERSFLSDHLLVISFSPVVVSSAVHLFFHVSAPPIFLLLSSLTSHLSPLYAYVLSQSIVLRCMLLSCYTLLHSTLLYLAVPCYSLLYCTQCIVLSYYTLLYSSRFSSLLLQLSTVNALCIVLLNGTMYIYIFI